MMNDKLSGHLSTAAAYTIFGLNIVFCKDIANSEVVAPEVLFTLRAIGASALFWLISLFLPKERIEKGDSLKIVAASFTGLFVPQMTFLMAITMYSPHSLPTSSYRSGRNAYVRRWSVCTTISSPSLPQL